MRKNVESFGSKTFPVNVYLVPKTAYSYYLLIINDDISHSLEAVSLDVYYSSCIYMALGMALLFTAPVSPAELRKIVRVQPYC